MTKILLIEDEEAIRENILELLNLENFEAIAVENGSKGVQLAKEKKPDLIICDVSMPELDGYGVLQALRSEPATAMIPFIFLTALADKANNRKGMELGADDYLTKPCRPIELLNAIETRLKKQANINQQQSKKLEELRSSITFSLPHELRTPLNGILGFSELLLTEIDTLDPDEIKEMVQQIQTSGKRLYRLIQNFLLYAELELISTNSERIKALQNSQTDHVASLISQQATQQAQRSQRQADLHLQLEDTQLNISPIRLQKMIEELVDNACKFSIPGTTINLVSEVINNSFILSVSDKGRGMKPEQIANLGAYMQFERKLYEQQGSGLGLVIVKRIAELHRGSLTIESIPDQQTTVRVILPTSDY
ncbi:response regulator [Phormidium sp. LEGE 05292]|uniref:hybrid sensor histidine kinase/response regulator n=1 Tax=[Phormidium] sp. LEGE 05292 TaxID=767427 RepID=UPI00187E037C|nr:response regulator [Phormidium sp. LEGE 05292]MBE9228809.1 response regulator [Phormidium sp. LEGE 05292]